MVGLERSEKAFGSGHGLHEFGVVVGGALVPLPKLQQILHGDFRKPGVERIELVKDILEIDPAADVYGMVAIEDESVGQNGAFNLQIGIEIGM